MSSPLVLLYQVEWVANHESKQEPVKSLLFLLVTVNDPLHLLEIHLKKKKLIIWQQLNLYLVRLWIDSAIWQLQCGGLPSNKVDKPLKCRHVLMEVLVSLVLESHSF